MTNREAQKEVEHNTRHLATREDLEKGFKEQSRWKLGVFIAFALKVLNPPNETIPLNQKGMVFLYLCAMEKEIKNTTFQKFQFLTLCFYYL